MKLRVCFNEVDSVLPVRFIQTHCNFKADFGEVMVIQGGETYTGEYNVTPRVYQQTLETKDKVMKDNVTVEVIPYAQVINLSNGYTVTIG